jgi:ribose transport system substrate-binding protein
VGDPAGWVGYATMDNAFRILLHKPTSPAATPVRVFIRGNVSAAGDPPSAYEGYGKLWIKGYLKLWGLL